MSQCVARLALNSKVSLVSLLNFGAIVVTHLAIYIEIFRMCITVFKDKVPFLFLVTCTFTLVCVVGALPHHISGSRKDGTTNVSPDTKSRIKMWLACIKHIPVSGSYCILDQIFGSYYKPLKAGNTAALVEVTPQTELPFFTGRK